LILCIYSSDIAILGAGPAGIAAAITAAREGLDVIMIERYGCVGGGLTSMYVRPFLGSVENANIGKEIEQAVKEASSDMSSVEAAKYALTKLLHDAGVRVLLQSSICSVHT
jgi:ribulose 1,5-bisphosphate synthetase/thiazole synthase